jgi:uncharacterized protein
LQGLSPLRWSRAGWFEFNFAFGVLAAACYPLPRKRETIIAKIEAIRPALEAEGVRHVAFFGSRARGDFHDESDLDILLDVDPASKFSILELVRVERISSEAIGVSANAFMRRSLEPDFIASIKPDLIEVF